ncbi:MAG: hypothetical protein LBP50_09505 [Tannerella sp.]|jgi:hypothetical protein|nr:hypothetical protein [Tannerella sp.]
MLTIKRKKDERVIRAFTHKLADIPDGVTVSVNDLSGKRLLEGTPIGGRDAGGLYHVLKTATLAAAVTASDTNYPVLKGHHFMVGDVIMLSEGGKASAITSVDTSGATSDTLAVGATLGVAGAAGDAVYQAKTATAGSDSALKHEPVALVGESYDVEQTNLYVNAWTIGQVRESNIPAAGEAVKSRLKGIVFI